MYDPMYLNAHLLREGLGWRAIVGDGKILVSDLENVYRIRTEESGIDALAEYI